MSNQTPALLSLTYPNVSPSTSRLQQQQQQQSLLNHLLPKIIWSVPSIFRVSLVGPPTELMHITTPTTTKVLGCPNPTDVHILQKDSIIRSSNPRLFISNPQGTEEAQRNVDQMKTEVVPAESQGRRRAGLSQRIAYKGFQSASLIQSRRMVVEVGTLEGEAAVINPEAKSSNKVAVATGARCPLWSSAKMKLISHL